MNSTKVIFLDIDGVLNSHIFFRENLSTGSSAGDEKIDPKAVEQLNRITDATGAKLVISSSWRILFRDREQKLFDLLKRHGVTGEFIGTTPLNGVRRGFEIQDWLDTNKDMNVSKFIIIDDDSDMEHLMDHLIKTSMTDGLLGIHAQMCIAKLNE